MARHSLLGWTIPKAFALRLFCGIGTHPSTRRATKWRTRDSGALLLLAAVNIYIALPLFRLEYSQYMGSLDGVYIAMARYMRGHWDSLNWFSWWYAGMPFANVYQPIFHACVAAWSQVSGLSVARSYHFTSALFYCLGALTLYALIRRLAGSSLSALWGGLAYSLISPTAILAREMGRDIGGWWRPNRLHSMLAYSDVPHMAAVALVPLALLCLDRAREKPTWVRIWLASLAFALVLLTNIPGAIGLSLAIIAYAFSYGRSSWGVAAGALLLGYAMTAYFIPPSTLLTVLESTQQIHPANRFTSWHALYAALAAACGFAIGRLRARTELRFAAFYTLLAGGITLSWFWARLTVLAQPNRFYLELELAVILLLALLFSRHELVGHLLMVVLILACGMQVRSWRRAAMEWARPIDITQKSEYKVARWLHENAKGERVFATGSAAFWLNAFADSPQVLGCCDQGMLLNQARGAYYMMSQDFATAANVTTWLQAFGAHYVAVHGAHSTEIYKIFRNPRIFDGYLEQVYRDGDDAIYLVPSGTGGLAHAVRASDIVIRPPENGLDIAPLVAYARAMAEPNAIAAEWRAANQLAVRGTLRAGEVVSVQIAYHLGWQATQNGRSIAITKDGMGFMVIDPGVSGPISLQLIWNGGMEKRIAGWISLFVFASVLAGISRYAGFDDRPVAQ